MLAKAANAAHPGFLFPFYAQHSLLRPSLITCCCFHQATSDAGRMLKLPMPNLRAEIKMSGIPGVSFRAMQDIMAGEELVVDDFGCNSPGWSRSLHHS